MPFNDDVSLFHEVNILLFTASVAFNLNNNEKLNIDLKGWHLRWMEDDEEPALVRVQRYVQQVRLLADQTNDPRRRDASALLRRWRIAPAISVRGPGVVELDQLD